MNPLEFPFESFDDFGHAFRFYLGRNEMLSDSQTLIDAEQAYLASDGSFQAVIVSLLTSDSFMFRK